MIEDYTTIFNEGSKVWRYMNLASFMFLLQQKRLYFPSVNELRKMDPFEGKLPASTGVTVFDHGHERQTYLEPENAEILNRRMFVNCWHVAEYESAAMWKLYSGESGIAIQSVVSRLRSAFAADLAIRIQPVAYVNFTAHYNMEKTRFCKRKSFEYERELRLIYIDDNALTGLTNCRGKAIPVDLPILIEKVYVSPIAAQWFADVIRCETRRHRLSPVPLQQSSLVEPAVE